MTLSVIFLVSGCASTQELASELIKARNSGKEGVAKVYPVSEDQAWDITKTIFRWEKTDEIEEHRNENYVIASTGIKTAAFGSVMGVWIEPVNSDHTTITVLTRQRVEGGTLTRLTVPEFFNRFDQGVKIIKSGKKLPVIPPQD